MTIQEPSTCRAHDSKALSAPVQAQGSQRPQIYCNTSELTGACKVLWNFARTNWIRMAVADATDTRGLSPLAKKSLALEGMSIAA